MTTLIVAGLGVAGTALVARLVLNNMKHLRVLKLPTNMSMTSYYKGGFEPKMTKREAALILGISSSSSKDKIRQAHKRIMLLNHPDRGGSPYLAAKVNQAKDYLESGNKPLN